MHDKREMSREEKLKFLAHIEYNLDVFTDYSPTILRLVDDPDPGVRAQAIRCLWDYPQAGLIDRLIDKARHDPAQDVVSAALAGLGRYIYEGDVADFEHADEWRELIGENEEEISQADFERTRQFLLSVARDPQASVDSRGSALEALGFLADSEVTELIEQAYQSGDLGMKVSAIFAMGRQGTVRWADTLLREIDSPVPEVRYEAVRAAGESFLAQATPKLVKIAERAKDKDLRVAAILALGRTGGDDAFEFLEGMARSRSSVLREAAEAALEDWFTYHGETDLDMEELDMEEEDEDDES